MPAVIAASMTDAPAENFRLVAADFQPDGLPDLADAEAQRFYVDAIADAELIIVDNLSTTARGLRENEANSFGPLLSRLLAQRAAGRSVLVGPSCRQGRRAAWNLPQRRRTRYRHRSTRPPGYEAREGARFEAVPAFSGSPYTPPRRKPLCVT